MALGMKPESIGEHHVLTRKRRERDHNQPDKMNDKPHVRQLSDAS